MTTNEKGLIQGLVHVMKKVSQRVVPDFTPDPTILSVQTIWGALPTLFHTHTTQRYYYHTLSGEHLNH